MGGPWTSESYGFFGAFQAPTGVEFPWKEKIKPPPPGKKKLSPPGKIPEYTPGCLPFFKIILWEFAGKLIIIWRGGGADFSKLAVLAVFICILVTQNWKLRCWKLIDFYLNLNYNSLFLNTSGNTKRVTKKFVYGF